MVQRRDHIPTRRRLPNDTQDCPGDVMIHSRLPCLSSIGNYIDDHSYILHVQGIAAGLGTASSPSHRRHYRQTYGSNATIKMELILLSEMHSAYSASVVFGFGYDYFGCSSQCRVRHVASQPSSPVYLRWSCSSVEATADDNNRLKYLPPAHASDLVITNYCGHDYCSCSVLLLLSLFE